MEEVIAQDRIRPSDLPAPPKDAIRIVQACSRSGIDSRDLANIVANDPVLTAELLRVSNSAFFGFVSQVKSVARAVTVLGNRAVVGDTHHQPAFALHQFRHHFDP